MLGNVSFAPGGPNRGGVGLEGGRTLFTGLAWLEALTLVNDGTEGPDHFVCTGEGKPFAAAFTEAALAEGWRVDELAGYAGAALAG